MTPQTRRLSVTINILSYISRSKGNQAIKFHELIKYSVRNICLQKSCRKWGRETSSRPFSVLRKLYVWSKQEGFAWQEIWRTSIHSFKIHWNDYLVNYELWSCRILIISYKMLIITGISNQKKKKRINRIWNTM